MNNGGNGPRELGGVRGSHSGAAGGGGGGALRPFDLHFLLQSLHCFHLLQVFSPLLGFEADTNPSSLASTPQPSLLGAAALSRERGLGPDSCGPPPLCICMKYS